MITAHRRSINLAIGLILLALAVCRAKTQAFTIDEAHTYNEYVRLGWGEIFNGWFDANNHVLYSALARISISVFGLSEFTMRLPSLGGAALFLWSLTRLCDRLIPQTTFSVLTYLVVAANPPTLDFMVAARGYGLGLGLFAYALSEFVEWIVDQKEDRHILYCSLALGLAIGANLIFVFASTGAIAAALLWICHKMTGPGKRRVAMLVLPCALTALALWWFPFRNYASDRFYFGAQTIMESLETTEWVLFLHNPDRGDPFGNWYTLHAFRQWIVPAVVIGLLLTAAFKRNRPALTFLILTLAGTCAALWGAHTFVNIRYPAERTGLALIFLFLLSWMAAMAEHWRSSRSTRWLFAGPSLVLALILLNQFAGQFDPRYFGMWKGDWKMNQLMSQLKGRHGTIRAHWLDRESAEFYRDMYHLDFPEVPPHQGDKLELKGADFYVVPSITGEEAAAAGLHILYRDTATGTTLLERAL